MGAANTKIINALSGVLTRRDSKREEGTKTLFRVRSNSLDSISTALSFGSAPERQPPSRASSLDNLHTAPKYSRVINIHGKEYILLDNESIASRIADRKENTSRHARVRESPSLQDRGVPSPRVTRREVLRTRSDPVRSISHFVKEPDQFSDNFVTEDSAERSLVDDSQDSQDLSTESKTQFMPTRSILKDRKTGSSLDQTSASLPDDPDLLSKLLSDYPQIAPSVLSKLTPEEWDQVFNFTFASLGKSLQLIKQLIENQALNVPESRETNTSFDSLAHKHVTINEEVSTSTYDRGSIVAGIDGTTSVQTPSSREKPKQRRQRKDRPNSLPPVYLRSTESPESWREPMLDEFAPTHSRARANSHEGSYYRRCSSDPTKNRLSKPEQPYPCSSRTRRKKIARAQRNPDAPVDTSLDDNCPGVAKIRRAPRFCSHYVDRERKPKKDRSDDQLPYIPRKSIRPATTMLKHATEITEESIASAFARSTHKRFGTKHGSIENDELGVIDLGLSRHSRRFAHRWEDLDSPSTDMAVRSLDLNHPSMLKPTRTKKSDNNHYTGICTPQTLIHSHNHYHHIINYTQS
ncbi:uncharacterized protein LOC135345685 isoform X2 [Halichondria panicea]